MQAADIADALAASRSNRDLAPGDSPVYLVNHIHRIAEGAGKKRRGDVMRRLDLHGVRVLTGVQISNGDPITLTGTKQASEYTRIDKITFQPDGEEVVVHRKGATPAGEDSPTSECRPPARSGVRRPPPPRRAGA